MAQGDPALAMLRSSLEPVDQNACEHKLTHPFECAVQTNLIHGPRGSSPCHAALFTGACQHNSGLFDACENTMTHPFECAVQTNLIHGPRGSSPCHATLISGACRHTWNLYSAYKYTQTDTSTQMHVSNEPHSWPKGIQPLPYCSRRWSLSTHRMVIGSMLKTNCK